MKKLIKKITAAVLLSVFLMSSIISQSIRGNWENSKYLVSITGDTIIFKEKYIVGEYKYSLLNNGNSIQLTEIMDESRPFSDGVYSLSVGDNYLSINNYRFNREKKESELSDTGKVVLGVLSGLAAIGGGIALKEAHDDKVESDLLKNMNGNWKFVSSGNGTVYTASVQNQTLSFSDVYGYFNKFEMKIHEKDCELVSIKNSDYSPIKAGKYKISISKDKNILTIKNKEITYSFERIR